MPQRPTRPGGMVFDVGYDIRNDDISIGSSSSMRQACFSSFGSVITKGGDDRAILNSKGVNKYHCPATPVPRSLFRGSCTCNIPTEQSYSAAEAAHKCLNSGVVRCAKVSIVLTSTV